MPQTSNFGKQEAMCPGESQDFGVQVVTDASDGSKGESEKVCPGGVEEVPSTKKAEICPWEAGPGAVREGALDLGQDGESQGTRGAERHFLKASETVYPSEGSVSVGLFPQEDPVDTDHARVSLHGTSSPGKGLAELCVWEVTDPEGNKIKGTMADICPWEETSTQSDESSLLALPVTQANVPAAPEKSICLSVHRPLESFFPESKSVRPDVCKPPGVLPLEGVREQEPLESFFPENKSVRPDVCEPPGVLPLEGVSEQEPLEFGPGAKSDLEPSPKDEEAPESLSLIEDQGQMASEVQAGECSPPPDYPWDCE